MCRWTTEVKTGMIVEIITSKRPGNGPNRDWLKIVKTSEARTKIRSWFKKERREENIATGKEELEKEFKRNLISIPEEEYEEFLLNIARRQHINTLDDFLRGHRLWRRAALPHYAAGQGGIPEETTAPLPRRRRRRHWPPSRPLPKSRANRPAASSSRDWTAALSSLPSAAIRCRATRSSDLSPAATASRSTSRTASTSSTPRRRTRAAGCTPSGASNVTSEKFKSTIDITSQPRDTLLADVTILLSNMHIPMHALVAKESKDHSVILIQVTVEVNGVDQLNYLLNSLRAIKGVEDVRRTIQ